MFSYNMPNGNIIISINDRQYNKDDIIIQLKKLNDVKNSVDYYFRLATFEEYKFLCEYAESLDYPNVNPYDDRKPFNRDSYYMIDAGIVVDGNLLGDNGYSDMWIYYPIVVRDFDYVKDSVYIRESDTGIMKLVNAKGEYINLTFDNVKQLSEQLPLYVDVLGGESLSKLQEGIVSLQKRLVELNNNLDDVKDIKKVSWFDRIRGR